MTTTSTDQLYKVWLEIEEIDESRDHYQNVGEPSELTACASLDEAEAFVRGIEPATYAGLHTENPSTIVIHISGGLVQGVACSANAKVAVVDWDTEGASLEDGAIDVPGCSSAFVTTYDAEPLADWQHGDCVAALSAAGCDWQLTHQDQSTQGGAS